MPGHKKMLIIAVCNVQGTLPYNKPERAFIRTCDDLCTALQCFLPCTHWNIFKVNKSLSAKPPRQASAIWPGDGLSGHTWHCR